MAYLVLPPPSWPWRVCVQEPTLTFWRCAAGLGLELGILELPEVEKETRNQPGPVPGPCQTHPRRFQGPIPRGRHPTKCLRNSTVPSTPRSGEAHLDLPSQSCQAWDRSCPSRLARNHTLNHVKTDRLQAADLGNPFSIGVDALAPIPLAPRQLPSRHHRALIHLRGDAGNLGRNTGNQRTITTTLFSRSLLPLVKPSLLSPTCAIPSSPPLLASLSGRRSPPLAVCDVCLSPAALQLRSFRPSRWEPGGEARQPTGRVSLLFASSPRRLANRHRAPVPALFGNLVLGPARRRV